MHFETDLFESLRRGFFRVVLMPGRFWSTRWLSGFQDLVGGHFECWPPEYSLGIVFPIDFCVDLKRQGEMSDFIACEVGLCPLVGFPHWDGESRGCSYTTPPLCRVCGECTRKKLEHIPFEIARQLQVPVLCELF